MAVRVGINGFGRIGRNIMRAALADSDIDFVAVNDLTDAKTLAHLLKYDSVLGNLSATISGGADSITVDGDEFKVFASKDPGALPWKDLGVDVVFECTGKFTDRDGAAKHLAAGAKKVIITAPAKKPDITLVHGRERRAVRPGHPPHHLERLVHDQLPGAGREGAATTRSASEARLDDDDARLHQRPEPARPAAQGPAPRPRRRAVDHPDDDRRGDGRGRGAAGAQGQARRHLDARADAERLGASTWWRCSRRTVTADDVNGAMRAAAAGPLKGVLHVEDAPLVSIDFRGNPHSSIVDSAYTKVMDGDFVKVLAWYDNEWGYSNRCVDLLKKVARSL